MGGLGSGRAPDPSSRRTVVEDCIVVDIRQLIRRGIFDPGRVLTVWGHSPRFEEPVTTYLLDIVDSTAGHTASVGTGKALRIRHVNPSDWEYVLREERFVPVLSSRLHRGGLRHWFACPSLAPESPTRCGRRVAVLYLPPGCQDFACRQCHDLGYLRQQISAAAEASPLDPRRNRPKRLRSPSLSVFDDAPPEAGTDVLLFEDNSPADVLLMLLKHRMKELEFSEGEETYVRLMTFAMDQLRKARRPKPSIDALRKRFQL